MEKFKYEELEEATQNFSSSHLIGRGSHGNIYKGILKDGSIAAIKKQSLGLEKLDDKSKLKNEVRILSSLPQNQHIINLIGTSFDSGKNSDVLVMEHMPNGTLHDLIHLASKSAPLSWPKRAQIALQIARAVAFLHESNPLIIHRDIKPENILFDSTWNAKLADFGLAVSVPGDSLSQLTDSVSPPAGTIGYLDPCYTTPCKLCTKNDVYSFGIVLLEIISGTKAIDLSRTPASIVDWAVPLIKENRITELCDERVAVSRYMEDPITRILGIAAQCVIPNQEMRPSIKEIVLGMEHSMIERTRFPIWVNIIQSLILLKKRRRKVGTAKKCATAAAAATTTTTIICTTQASSHFDITRKKLLVREILADFTLS